MKRVFFLLVLGVLIAGCIGGGGGPPQPTTIYVTPCNVIGSGLVLRLNGSKLDTSMVSEPLSKSFVDDITSDKAINARKTYGLSCYWGSNIGERKDYYYCNGSYVAPDINDKGVIVRNLKKEFKIGFGVQEYKGDSWTDMNGVRHIEDSMYDLTVGSVDARCVVA